jgi:hypothetical protein
VFKQSIISTKERLVIMHPSLDKYKEYPKTLEGYTQITCIHAYHGTVIYYLPLEDFQASIKGIITPCWVNNYTVVITSM